MGSLKRLSKHPICSWVGSQMPLSPHFTLAERAAAIPTLSHEWPRLRIRPIPVWGSKVLLIQVFIQCDLTAMYLCCPLNSTAMWYRYLRQVILTSFPYLRWKSEPVTMTILQHPVTAVPQPLLLALDSLPRFTFTNTVIETTFRCLAQCFCFMSGLTLRRQTASSRWEWQPSHLWICLWFSSIKPRDLGQFPVTSSPGPLIIWKLSFLIHSSSSISLITVWY